MPFNRAQAITEIQQRNRLRKSASLPLLDIEAELARLEQVHEEAQFNTFLEQNRALLDRFVRRAVFRHQQWPGAKLNWIFGITLNNQIRSLFRRRFVL